MRIVVIDDDPLFLRLIGKAFEAECPDAVVLSAPGISRALDVLQQLKKQELPPDLIVVDSTLGDGSGLRLLDSLRADDRLAEVPAVIVTAGLDNAIRAEAESAGAAGCYQKPAGFDRLVELAGELITLTGRW